MRSTLFMIFSSTRSGPSWCMSKLPGSLFDQITGSELLLGWETVGLELGVGLVAFGLTSSGLAVYSRY